MIPISGPRDRTTLLAIRARWFGRLKVCPDWKDSDGNTESRGINRILFHAADAGTIRVYAENGNGPVFLTLRLDNGRMRVEDKQPVDAALLYEAEHGGGDIIDLFLDPRCSYRSTGHSSMSNCLIVRQSNLT